MATLGGRPSNNPIFQLRRSKHSWLGNTSNTVPANMMSAESDCSSMVASTHLQAFACLAERQEINIKPTKHVRICYWRTDIACLSLQTRQKLKRSRRAFLIFANNRRIELGDPRVLKLLNAPTQRVLVS